MEGEHITDFESPASTARSTGESESFEDVRSYGDATHKDATGAPASTKDDAPDHTAALRAAPPTDEVSDSRSDPYTSAAEGRDDDHLVDRDDGDDDDADEYGDGGFPPVPGSGGDEYSNGEYPDDAAAAAADDTHDDGGGPLYDETLPDGRTVRRRRRSHDEADDLPDSDKDADLAASYKEEGNRNFGSGEHEAAAACYKEALRVIPRGEQYNAPRSVFYSNRAACFLQLGRNEEALYDCDRALENCPGYVKALARRATALERLGKLDEALRGEPSIYALSSH